MSLFEDFIKKLIKNRTFLEVDRECYESELLFGRFFQQSENFLCLEKFDDNGEYDGIAVIRKDDVSSIEIGGNRITATEKLIKEKELNTAISIDTTSLRTVVESVTLKFGYVAIYEEEYSEDFYIGEILEIDDDFLLLNEYGTKKSLDRRQRLLRLDSITRIESDGKYEKGILQTFSSI